MSKTESFNQSSKRRHATINGEKYFATREKRNGVLTKSTRKGDYMNGGPSVLRVTKKTDDGEKSVHTSKTKWGTTPGGRDYGSTRTHVGKKPAGNLAGKQTSVSAGSKTQYEKSTKAGVVKKSRGGEWTQTTVAKGPTKPYKPRTK